MSPERNGGEFRLLASLPDEEIRLDRAALLIAADEYPGLDVEAYLKRLDMLAAGVSERLPSNAAPDLQVSVLSDYLFHQRRFRGNADNYYDPRNSYLNEVLDRRAGLPITLSIMTMEVGRRAGIPLRGIGLPGHFVVRYDSPELDLFLDPFNSGRILTAEDCHEIILQYLEGQSASFGHFLHPSSPRAILVRLLSNLKVIYLHHGDMERMLRVLNRILQLNPRATDEYRERGLLHMAAQRYRAALTDLTTYLNHCPNAPDAPAVHERLEVIWKALGIR